MKKENLYGEKFYQEQMDGSYLSAIEYVSHLSKIFIPNSVADLGCGRGMWLKAFSEYGAEKLVGFDGHWNSQEKMVDQLIKYRSTDLNQPIDNLKERFDLAISLEVAEHLKEESSTTFVENLISLSDVVMFGAAYPHQGGTEHINEQPHAYWAKKFIKNDYIPYDVFRPTMWGKENVEYWYQQNTFLYVKKTSKINQLLIEAGYEPISNIDFMNCIHPHLYNRWVYEGTKKNKLIRIKIIPKKWRPFFIQLKSKLFK